jgi:hypothetical protein
MTPETGSHHLGGAERALAKSRGQPTPAPVHVGAASLGVVAGAEDDEHEPRSSHASGARRMEKT